MSIGASTLYSKVKTSQPISPWEYSSMRASKRRRTSGGSFWAFEERIAVSSVAVRLWRYNVFAGRDRLGLAPKDEDEYKEYIHNGHTLVYPSADQRNRRGRA